MREDDGQVRKQVHRQVTYVRPHSVLSFLESLEMMPCVFCSSPPFFSGILSWSSWSVDTLESAFTDCFLLIMQDHWQTGGDLDHFPLQQQNKDVCLWLRICDYRISYNRMQKKEAEKEQARYYTTKTRTHKTNDGLQRQQQQHHRQEINREDVRTPSDKWCAIRIVPQEAHSQEIQGDSSLSFIQTSFTHKESIRSTHNEERKLHDVLCILK